MIGKIKNIVGAYTKALPEDEEWYQERLKHCIECSLNIKNMKTPGKTDETVLKLLGDTTKGVCSICHCPVDRKAAVKAETCALKLRGEQPKWEPIEIQNMNINFELKNTTNFSLHQDDRRTVIKAVTDKETETLTLVFKGYELKVAEPSCGCMKKDIDIVEPREEYNINLTIDTQAFSKNIMTLRNLQLEYIHNGRRKEHTVRFEIIKK